MSIVWLVPQQTLLHFKLLFRVYFVINIGEEVKEQKFNLECLVMLPHWNEWRRGIRSTRCVFICFFLIIGNVQSLFEEPRPLEIWQDPVHTDKKPTSWDDKNFGQWCRNFTTNRFVYTSFRGRQIFSTMRHLNFRICAKKLRELVTETKFFFFHKLRF